MSGGKYIGGIAGYAHNISGCVSMPSVSDGEEYTGAIAGEVSDDYSLHDNYYYSETLGGIDKISYEDMAKCVSFDELIGMEGVPKEFGKLVVTFLTGDDIETGSISVEYNGSISSEDYPKPYVEDGNYIRWEIDSAGNIVSKEKDDAGDPVSIAFNKSAGADGIDWNNLADAYNYSNAQELRSMKFTVVTDSTTDPVTTEEHTLAEVLSTDGNYGLNISELTADKMTPAGSSLLKYDTTTGAFVSIAGGTGVTLGLSQLAPAGRFTDIDIDFSTTTMYNNAGTSTIAAASGDENKIGAGRKLGEMSGVSIQNDGRIYASYDNGMSKLLGQIAVAEFANASGLEKEGDNLYKSTQNSGDFDGIGTEVTAGGGYMTTGVLEMSNVDLSAEFTDMITTQRGFQANSRIITVSDTLLEELVNLKR